MNITMDTTPKQHKPINYNDFITKYNVKQLKDNGEQKTPTHTRIPDKELKIYGGSFMIPDEAKAEFYKLYYDYIFNKHNKEYLTEKQLESGGPMAVDFDFRYEYDTVERPHTKENVSDMICEYLEALEDCFIIQPDVSFDIYIFEKPHVNRLEDGSLTKDGIHMIIGLQIDHTMQLVIRNKMLQKLPEIWELPLLNNWASVLDEGISKGKTNWQLFGSRKPGNEAYEFTYYYKISKDKSDNQFVMNEIDIADFDLKNNFEKLSVQYKNHPKFSINPKIQKYYDEITGKKKSSVKKASSKIKKTFIVDKIEEEEEEEEMEFSDITNSEKLNKAMSIILNKLSFDEYSIKETHLFTQALPDKYYNPGTHLENRKVAFALKHTDERLFLSWVMLRSKADDFEYNTIPNLYEEWKRFQKSNTNNECITKRSIMYWVKQENIEEYNKIKKDTIDYYLDNALKDGTEYDFALILKQMYKDNYVCVSYDKKGIWYQFKNHRWNIDHGLSLRSKISEELSQLVVKKQNKLFDKRADLLKGTEERELLEKKITSISTLSLKLKKTNDKNNIMREAAEIFYDNEFVRNMDKNKYLLCFKNGVIDFKNKVFREGYPEDYITKSTKINYIPYEKIIDDSLEYFSKKEYLIKFMKQLFDIDDLNEYMWSHLASSLIGTNKNQTFNVYYGDGSNGKSILADLMSATLGEYKGTVPITLVTEKRGLIGGTSDEVLKLKGVRYAVMQEPSKGVKLNEGIMKELTGGDPIQARGLYLESEVFEPQFNLVVCTNNLFDITSNDEGTWRRIRKVEFKSTFVDNIENCTQKYLKDKLAKLEPVFPKDKYLKDKLSELAPVFASMLVNKAFETDGIVKDCETVKTASDKYREKQDHINAFICEEIIRTDDPNDKIRKRDVKGQFTKWFDEEHGTGKKPKMQELYEAINKKFESIEYKKNCWIGLKMIDYDKPDSNETEENEN